MTSVWRSGGASEGSCLCMYRDPECNHPFLLRLITVNTANRNFRFLTHFQVFCFLLVISTSFTKYIQPPGDSKWPLDSLVGGYLTFERVTGHHSKKVTKNCQNLFVAMSDCHLPGRTTTVSGADCWRTPGKGGTTSVVGYGNVGWSTLMGTLMQYVHYILTYCLYVLSIIHIWKRMGHGYTWLDFKVMYEYEYELSIVIVTMVTNGDFW